MYRLCVFNMPNPESKEDEVFVTDGFYSDQF